MIRQTLETRWFFKEPPFELASLPSGSMSEARTDWYATPCNPGNGIKFREGLLETKLLVADLGLMEFAGAQSFVQTWQKWSVAMHQSPPSEELLESTGWVAVSKRRHIWCFEVEDDAVRTVSNRVTNGCEFEWTQLDLLGQTWWTIGLESIGPEKLLKKYLDLIAQKVFSGQAVDQLTAEQSMSYPAWLAMLVDR